MDRIYIIGGAILAFVIAILYIIILHKELKEEKSLKEQALFEAWSAKEGEKLAVENRTTLLNKQKAIKDENDKLKSCIANGSCGVRLNAVCDGATGSSPGVLYGVPRLTPIAEQGLLDTNEGIDRNKALFDSCVKTLEDWKTLVKKQKE